MLNTIIIVLISQISLVSGWLWGTGYAPYANAMTPSGYPIYGMAPYASAAVANSGPPPVYSYGAPGIASDVGSGGGGINFDSLPVGQVQPGMQVGQPVAVRYFNQPIPVNIDPSATLAPGTTLMRVPIYGIMRHKSIDTVPVEETPHVSKYSKFNNIHTVDSDVVRGYQPAYSNWNKQPIQAVFRQESPPPVQRVITRPYVHHPPSPSSSYSSGIPNGYNSPSAFTGQSSLPSYGSSGSSSSYNPSPYSTGMSNTNNAPASFSDQSFGVSSPESSSNPSSFSSGNLNGHENGPSSFSSGNFNSNNSPSSLIDQSSMSSSPFSSSSNSPSNEMSNLSSSLAKTSDYRARFH